MFNLLAIEQLLIYPSTINFNYKVYFKGGRYGYLLFKTRYYKLIYLDQTVKGFQILYNEKDDDKLEWLQNLEWYIEQYEVPAIEDQPGFL